MPRELYHERDVKRQRCHLKEMSRERERGKNKMEATNPNEFTFLGYESTPLQ
jgi:hypothetical protein